MTDSRAIPRGIQRGPSSAATPPRPDPSRNGSLTPTCNRSALRGDLPAEIAREQIRQLEELSLVGYPSLSQPRRAVYEATLRLAAERVLDDA